MAETVKRFREPAALGVLGISVVYILISLVRWGYLLVQGEPLSAASRAVGGSSLSIVMVLLCFLAATACLGIAPATRRATQVVRWAAMVVGLAAALEAIFLVLGVPGAPGGPFVSALEVLGGLLEISLKAAAAVLLVRTLRGTREEQAAALPERPRVVEVESVEESEPQAASWKADQAAGAVWTRAGDAASGAAASTWGHPGESSSGWQPARPDGPAELEAPSAAGPWPTAGQRAAGHAIAPPTQDAQGGTPIGQGAVSWSPLPREE
ncbi:hypothetical protein GCM10027030_02980 [Luteococcus sediminum]